MIHVLYSSAVENNSRQNAVYDESTKHRYQLPTHPTLQMHYTENPKQIFPEMKLRSIVLNFYINKIGRLIAGKYKSLTDT